MAWLTAGCGLIMEGWYLCMAKAGVKLNPDEAMYAVAVCAVSVLVNIVAQQFSLRTVAVYAEIITQVNARVGHA